MLDIHADWTCHVHLQLADAFIQSDLEKLSVVSSNKYNLMLVHYIWD